MGCALFVDHLKQFPGTMPPRNLLPNFLPHLLHQRDSGCFFPCADIKNFNECTKHFITFCFLTGPQIKNRYNNILIHSIIYVEHKAY